MEAFFTFDTIQAGTVLLFLLVMGDYTAKKLKGKIPGILVSGAIFMLLSWGGFFPEDLMKTGGFSELTSIATALIIIGLGASMSIRTFVQNWKVVVLAMSTYLCSAAAILAGLSILFGFHLAIGALPGGLMTAFVIQQRAAELGYSDTIVLSVLYLSTKTILATVIASHFVRKESKRLLALPRGEEDTIGTQTSAPERGAFFNRSNYGELCKLYLVAWGASGLEGLTGINMYILCMVLGVLAAQVGFLNQDSMSRCGAENFFFFLMMAKVMCGFGEATPAMLAQMVVPLMIAFALEVVVILYIVPPVLGKLLGFSRDMSVALGSNIMMGFPLNMMISNEIAGNLTEDPEERKYLGEQIAAKMVIAGLSTTTSLAVFTGSLLVGFMG